MPCTKPQRLKAGDTVAVLSPSWGGPSRFPHVFDLGLRNLERLLEVRIKEYPTARMDADETYRNPAIRAKDINDAFADPEVNAIITSIGGDDSVRILPFLDLDLIRKNPKIFMGYSDTTAIHCYLNAAGLVTFNGPSVMAGFAQARHLPPELTEHVRQILMDPADVYRYRPYPAWTDHYVDWNTPGYDGEVDGLLPNGGLRWLQGSGLVEGTLWGGCIEVHEFLKGTRFWPSHDWSDKILFFETSEDKPTVANVKYMVRNYGSMGVLEQARAVIFGRARAYSEAEKRELEEILVKIIAGEFGRTDIPIVANADFGHTDPQWIMPLGVRARVDCDARTFSLLEAAVT